MLKANIRYEDGTGGTIKELLGVEVVREVVSQHMFLFRIDPGDLYQGIPWTKIIKVSVYEEK